MRLTALVLAFMSAGCATLALSSREARLGKTDAASLGEVPVCGHEAGFQVAAGAMGDEGRGVTWVVGEILAATPEAVFIARQGRMDAVPVPAIRTVKVRVLESRSGALMTWTLVGTLPAVLVFYVWVPMGLSLAASDEAQGWAEGAPDAALLSQYARFPQGLPPGWPPVGAPAEPCPYPGPAASRAVVAQP